MTVRTSPSSSCRSRLLIGQIAGGRCSARTSVRAVSVPAAALAAGPGARCGGRGSRSGHLNTSGFPRSREGSKILTAYVSRPRPGRALSAMAALRATPFKVVASQQVPGKTAAVKAAVAPKK